jgi:hypothetical protein
MHLCNPLQIVHFEKLARTRLKKELTVSIHHFLAILPAEPIRTPAMVAFPRIRVAASLTRQRYCASF